MINFSETDDVHEYLKDSKTVKIYNSNEGFEGGLVIVFNKNSKNGIYIMGYTELGNWVYHFEHDGNFYLGDNYHLKEINKIRNDNGFPIKIRRNNSGGW